MKLSVDVWQLSTSKLDIINEVFRGMSQENFDIPRFKKSGMSSKISSRSDPLVKNLNHVSPKNTEHDFAQILNGILSEDQRLMAKLKKVRKVVVFQSVVIISDVLSNH